MQYGSYFFPYSKLRCQVQDAIQLDRLKIETQLVLKTPILVNGAVWITKRTGCMPDVIMRFFHNSMYRKEKNMHNPSAKTIVPEVKRIFERWLKNMSRFCVLTMSSQHKNLFMKSTEIATIST